MASRSLDALEAFRAPHVAVVGGHGEPHQDQQLEDVLQQSDPGVAPNDGEIESRHQPLAELLDHGGQQDQEAAEDHQVEHPGVE